MMVEGTLWCRRCGCLRGRTEKTWGVPLDRSGALSAAVVEAEETAADTEPGTPVAKRDSIPG
jgi:hypothetical protein